MLDETNLPELPKLPKTEGNYVTRESNGFWSGFISALFIIAFLVMMGFLVYYVSDGKFQSDINQNVDLKPVIQNNFSINDQDSNVHNNDFNFDQRFNMTMSVQNLNLYLNCS